MKGLEGLLSFLEFLVEKNISYSISHQREDSVMVSFTLVGVRVEVDFFVDHIEFSYFKGNEDVISDEKRLFELIAENWS